jgi:hypothetical protein
MSAEYRQNDTDLGKANYSEIKFFHCHSMNRKHHTYWRVRDRPVSNRLIHVRAQKLQCDVMSILNENFSFGDISQLASSSGD